MKFNVQAVVSGREVSNDTLTGTAVLVLHGPRTTDAPKVVGKAVRQAYPLAADVVVANVVNLKSMAGLWKKAADAQMKASYGRLATKLTEVDPADYVMICPDYDNAVGPEFGFEDTNQKAAVVVLKDGEVVGASDEGDLAQHALGWLN